MNCVESKFVFPLAMTKPEYKFCDVNKIILNLVSLTTGKCIGGALDYRAGASFRSVGIRAVTVMRFIFHSLEYRPKIYF